MARHLSTGIAAQCTHATATGTRRTGTRSLDTLHVAVAKGLRLKEFVSFDTRQREPAAAAGLTDAL
jgi:predicted nucleic acid-binding protein